MSKRYLVLTELFLPTKGGTAVWFDQVYRRLGGKVFMSSRRMCRVQLIMTVITPIRFIVCHSSASRGSSRNPW